MFGMTARNDVILACLLLGFWSATVAVRFWDVWAIDLAAVYFAGFFVWNGAPELMFGAASDGFAVGVPQAWVDEIERQGFAGNRSAHFVYPPIWAYIMAPFAGLSDVGPFLNVTRAILTVLFSASVVLAWRIMGRAMPLMIFAVIAILFAETMVPLLFAFELGQPQLLVIFLCLASYDRYLSGHHTSAGVLLGLAAAIKVTPVLLCLAFLADRNWRAAAICVGTAAFMAVLSFAFAGIDLHRMLLFRSGEIDSLVPITGLNLTFETMVHDFFVQLKRCMDCELPLHGVNTPSVTLASKLLLPLGLIAMLFGTRQLRFEDRTRLRLLLGYLIIAFFGPIAWIHYYILPILLFPGLVRYFEPRTVLLAALPFWAGFSHIWIGHLVGRASETLSFGSYLPQHAALLSLGVLLALAIAAIWKLSKDHPLPASAEPA